METLNPLERLLAEKLKPFVKKVDAQAYYAEDYLVSLGKAGLLQSRGVPLSQLLANEARLVEETARMCMTTAFNLWCHLASMTYVRNSDNDFLRSEILPLLENGDRLGGTGLSNPMKYYAGLETLNLKATRTAGGYIVNGDLGAVSNLGPGHWFGIVASAGEEQRIMALVSCDVPGLTLKEKAVYLGVNGSATYSCKFTDVFVPDQWLLSGQADDFALKIRPAFIVYQVPLALGVIDESIRAIGRVRSRQNGCNSFLRVQTDEIEAEFGALRERFYGLIQANNLYEDCQQLLQSRLDAAYLALKAVQACMLHQGGAAYLQNSPASRRLREAYFFANLTPTVKHLEKLLCESNM